jgi:hypothetical protein
VQKLIAGCQKANCKDQYFKIPLLPNRAGFCFILHKTPGMVPDKVYFLKFELVPLFRKLDGSEKARWGVMSAQGMVEHFVDALKNANGKLILPVVNSGERLEKLRTFLMTEKPFKENTKNPLMSDIPAPLRKPDINKAIDKLSEELDHFFVVFEANPNLRTMNPVFGELDYEMNVQLICKHALHHLRQFGVEPVQV